MDENGGFTMVDRSELRRCWRCGHEVPSESRCKITGNHICHSCVYTDGMLLADLLKKIQEDLNRVTNLAITLYKNNPPSLQKINISSERAKELLRKGDKLLNWSSHATLDEVKEIFALWSTMPNGTCWYDALVRVANGQEEY